MFVFVLCSLAEIRPLPVLDAPRRRNSLERASRRIVSRSLLVRSHFRVLVVWKNYLCASAVDEHHSIELASQFWFIYQFFKVRVCHAILGRRAAPARTWGGGGGRWVFAVWIGQQPQIFSTVRCRGTPRIAILVAPRRR